MAIPLPRPSFGSRDSRSPAPRPDPVGELVSTLREELITSLHMGRLHAGDRFPSIRATAHDRGVDHRVVARAYRELEAEGWLQVRGRSGVRVAPPQTSANSFQRDWTLWIVDVIAEGWRHNLTPRQLAGTFQRCANTAGLHCACVESNHDQMTAYCAEVGAATGMTLIPAFVDPEDRERISRAEIDERLSEILQEVDMVITTQYHAAAVRRAGADARASLVVLSINPDLASVIGSRIRESGLTVIATTSEFGERLRLMYGSSISDDARLRLVLVNEAGELAEEVDREEPVLLTRAARERAPALGRLQLVYPHSPTLAEETIREISAEIVRLNLIRHHAGLVSAR